MDTQTSRVVTIREAGELLRLGRSTIYGLMDDGTLRTIKIGARRLVLRDSIEALFRDAR